MDFAFHIWVFAFTLVLTSTDGYDTGSGTCNANSQGVVDLAFSMPGRSLQAGDGGYQLQAPQFFVKDEPLSISLSAAVDPFSGFVINVRNPSDGTAVGAFSNLPANVGPPTTLDVCYQNEDLSFNTVTHSDDANKTNVDLTWTMNSDIDTATIEVLMYLRPNFFVIIQNISVAPTPAQTVPPTAIPSTAPTVTPSESPTGTPAGATASPTVAPTGTPTGTPTYAPTQATEEDEEEEEEKEDDYEGMESAGCVEKDECSDLVATCEQYELCDKAYTELFGSSICDAARHPTACWLAVGIQGSGGYGIFEELWGCMGCVDDRTIPSEVIVEEEEESVGFALKPLMFVYCLCVAFSITVI